MLLVIIQYNNVEISDIKLSALSRERGIYTDECYQKILLVSVSNKRG